MFVPVAFPIAALAALMFLAAPPAAAGPVVLVNALDAPSSGEGLAVAPGDTVFASFSTGEEGNLSAITVKGAANNLYAQNLGFTKDAFGLVTVPMEVPQGVDFAAREMYKNISMRIIRAYDIWNDVMPVRVDILYGVSTYYPELACRLSN